VTDTTTGSTRTHASGRGTPPLPELILELRDLVVAYLKQETLVPAKQLGKYLAWGAGGAALLGLGCVFLTMSLLRVLQEETGTTFTGNLSWLPYFITLAAALLVAGLFWVARGSRKKASQP
jgi:putative superfamily III holin-X